MYDCHGAYTHTSVRSYGCADKWIDIVRLLKVDANTHLAIWTHECMFCPFMVFLSFCSSVCMSVCPSVCLYVSMYLCI